MPAVAPPPAVADATPGLTPYQRGRLTAERLGPIPRYVGRSPLPRRVVVPLGTHAGPPVTRDAVRRAVGDEAVRLMVQRAGHPAGPASEEVRRLLAWLAREGEQ